MSKPSSREQLKQYALRQLGKPVIEINVDDDQLEDRIDEGIQFFQEYHFDGIEKMYHTHRVTASSITISSINGNFSNSEVITGSTSNATATIHTIETSPDRILFKHHKDTNGISNNAISSSFTDGETITGKISGATATAGTVTFGDIDNHYIPISDAITGIIGIFDIRDTASSMTSNMFSFRYQFHLNEMPYLQSGSAINYSLSMQHLQLLSDMFAGKKPIRFNRHQNRLYLDLDWENEDIEIDEYIVAEAYRIIDPDTFTDVYNDMFLKKYVTALFKRQWGANLIKYQGVSLPGGITLDGRQIFEDAQTEIRDIEEQMQSRYELPIDFMVGPG